MTTRKTPAERIADYKAKAATIEERERRKLLARAPHWMAIKRAIENLELAISCIPDEAEQLGDVCESIRNELVGRRIAEID